jgi:hypothetical protein
VHYINCTFGENSGGTVGGLSVHRDGRASVTNCIFWNNSPKQISVRGIREDDFSELYINYTDVQFGLDSIEVDTLAVVYWQEGNISSDPQWLDPMNGNYELRDESPCIDAGINSIEVAGIQLQVPMEDMNNLPRAQYLSQLPDMGAHEFQMITEVDGVAGDRNEILKTYPNPCKQHITFEFFIDKGDEINVTVYDIMGNKIADVFKDFLPGGTHQITWNLRSADDGLYLCRLTSANMNIVKKIIVRR